MEQVYFYNPGTHMEQFSEEQMSKLQQVTIK